MAGSFFAGREWRGRPYLISPFMDGLLAGGLALIIFPLLFFFYPPGNAHIQDQKLMMLAITAVAAFIANDPHFMISYQLMYRGFGAKLHRFREHKSLWRRYIVAGIIVPLLMGAYFLYALFTNNPALFGHAINLMLLIVGWHYVKQAYGIFIMLSAMKKIFYSAWQKQLFLVNSYMVWAFYALGIIYEQGLGEKLTQTIWGVEYQPFNFPSVPENFMFGIFVLFLVMGFASLIVSFWGRKASTTALIGYGSMYYFLLPAALHPMWILLYPFFHSLQYLMFVYAYKRGEARENPAVSLLSFTAIAVITGALFFVIIPKSIETVFLGAALPVSAAFILFINIHHYFIDNVIWRKEHSEIARYLFSR